MNAKKEKSYPSPSNTGISWDPPRVFGISPLSVMKISEGRAFFIYLSLNLTFRPFQIPSPSSDSSEGHFPHGQQSSMLSTKPAPHPHTYATGLITIIKEINM